MNPKELFYIFLKNSGIVINRYKELMTPIVIHNTYDKSVVREDFEISLNEAKKTVNHDILCSGRSGSEYRYSFPNYYFYLGKQGWDKYGIFSYIPLYEKAKWTLDIIEKHKEDIAWLLLFEFGDFKFTEDVLRKYDQYIPWVDCSEKEKKYISFSKPGFVTRHGTSLSNFENVGLLSSDFILSHISVIDINALCKTAEFEITTVLFERFYKEAESEDLKGIDNINSPENMIITHRYSLLDSIINGSRVLISCDTVWYIASVLNVYNWEKLLLKIELTPKRLFDFYRLNPDSLEVFYNSSFETRKNIISMIQQEKAFLQIIQKDYIKRLYQGGEQNVLYSKSRLYFLSGGLPKLNQEACERAGFKGLKNLPYTYDFSVDLIKENIDSWNQQSYEYFNCSSRTPDTNYYYYKRVTAWDILSRQETILLTYDTCKYLMSIEVKIGGSYTLEDNSYHTDDIPNRFINGLKLFQSCSVKDEDELVKILNDTELVGFLLSNAVIGETCIKVSNKGDSIVDRIILDFFKDFSFENFEKLVVAN